MKKAITTSLLLMSIFIFTGCVLENKDSDETVLTPDSPNTLPPSVMLNDIIYINSGINISDEIEESKIIGYITSVVPLTEWPAKNGETNFAQLKDAPYAEYEDGIVVWWGYDVGWRLFRPRD